MIKGTAASCHAARSVLSGLGHGWVAYTRSALLNHSDTRTVAQYDHLLPDELIEARAKQHAGLETYLRSGFSSSSERAPETPKEQ